MARPISVQLYTLRDAAAKDYKKVLNDVAEIGYGYVELVGGYFGKTAAELRKDLDAVGLKASGIYCGVLDPNQWKQVEDDANALGVKFLTNGFGPESFDDESKLKAAADKANAAVAHFAPKGFSVCLHNHEFEFNRKLKFDALLELAPKVCLETDIYWVKTGGVDPVGFVKKYADRVRLLHVKDGPADPKDRNLKMVAVGKGTVDIAGCLAAAEKGGVQYHVVELDWCATDMLTAVRESYQFLTSKGLATGKK
ncbi:MAG TPA: sugar phosphate isomerase/epimerase [Planctomycetota bacterium]|nr:sugar phosphate isomerase/epimerase [Planctomycetota bacterium]